MATPQTERARLNKATPQNGAAETRPTSTAAQSDRPTARKVSAGVNGTNGTSSSSPQSNRSPPPKATPHTGTRPTNKRIRGLVPGAEPDNSPNPPKRMRTGQLENGTSANTLRTPSAGSQDRPSTNRNATTVAECPSANGNAATLAGPETEAVIIVDTSYPPAATPRPSRSQEAETGRRHQSSEDRTAERRESSATTATIAVGKEMSAQTILTQRGIALRAAAEHNTEEPFHQCTRHYVTALELKVSKADNQLSEARQLMEAREKAMEPAREAALLHDRRATTALAELETAEANTKNAKKALEMYEKTDQDLRQALGPLLRADKVEEWVSNAVRGSQLTLDESKARLREAEAAEARRRGANGTVVRCWLKAEENLDRLTKEHDGKKQELFGLQINTEKGGLWYGMLMELVQAKNPDEGMALLKEKFPGILSQYDNVVAKEAAGLQNGA